MIDQTTLDGKIIIAAFDLAASPGWAEVSLRDIAEAAGCSLADVMERFSSKDAVLACFVNHVDRAMLANAGNIEREQSSRDAVFEVIMSRFDLLAPYRVGLKSILAAGPTTPIPDPAALRMTLRTQNMILQAAGISAAGAPALIRQLGLARVYAQVFRTWLDDEDPGMARTMAALDRRLRQGEQSLRTLDDVAKSGERVCEQATSLATRLLSALRAAADRRRGPADDTTDAGPDETPPATGSDPVDPPITAADRPADPPPGPSAA